VFGKTPHQTDHRGAPPDDPSLVRMGAVPILMSKFVDGTTVSPTSVVARRLLITGHVQAVGFRPFLYRLAHQLGLAGWVQNQTGQVAVQVEGPQQQVNAFRNAVMADAPPLARPIINHDMTVTAEGRTAFEILPSAGSDDARIFVPPDYFTCPECLRELEDPEDRRFLYPFINCTQCGPRYTLISRLPYDRVNTTMASFPLCEACRREYENPLDRRFHAEPLAYAVCGPGLEFVASADEAEQSAAEPLDRAVAALRSGRIVAVKGVGGYHLLCDACNEDAVVRLRERKGRPAKPLAVMLPPTGTDGLDWARRCAIVRAETAALMTDPMRPIVLAEKADDSPLATAVAPGLDELGLFLPYSPLHHLLLSKFDGPLVATSGNLSGEPVLTNNDEAARRLRPVADSFLHHNRPIERPADDPVFRHVGGAYRPIRLGRGAAPLELELPFHQTRPVLAVGAHLKTTVALSWDNRVVISPHIGDMSSPRSLDVLEQVAADLQRLYQVEAETLICDAHKHYTNHRWAKTRGLPVQAVWHHHAHASALVAEHAQHDNWLIFTWDGVGLGPDGTLWGGETLLGAPGRWQRVASLRPFRLPGAESVGREPWRSAASLCWELGEVWDAGPNEDPLLQQAWQRNLNSPVTSAAGRLFDAAAAFAIGVYETSYEGEGPMLLEALCHGGGSAIALPREQDQAGVWRIDWAPLVAYLRDTKNSVSDKADTLHLSLAAAIAALAKQVSNDHDVTVVGLTGGVFQNRVLTGHAMRMLKERGFDVALSKDVPCNDAGISLGQVTEHAARKIL
jgi:hydrogenase maturation protein HypF